MVVVATKYKGYGVKAIQKKRALNKGTMKIKTLRIKSESIKEGVDFRRFFEDFYTLVHINSKLEAEADGYYWHIWLAYEEKDAAVQMRERIALESYMLYENELRDFVQSQDGKAHRRSLNVVINNLERIANMHEVAEVAKLRNVGDMMMMDDKAFFEAVLAIAKKYQEQV